MALLLPGEGRPAGVEVGRGGHDLLGRETVDLQDVPRGLQGRQLLLDLLEPVGERLVPGAEVLFGEAPCLVQLDERVLLLGNFVALGFEDGDELLLLPDEVAPGVEVLGDLVRGDRVGAQLLVDDAFEVDDGDLVPAGLADVPGLVRGVDVELPAALAEGLAGEEVDGTLQGALPGRPAGVEDGVALVPEVIGHDPLALVVHPVALGLERNGLRFAHVPGVVRDADAFGSGVA